MKTVNRRDLLETPLPELMAAAAAARDAQFGTRVTFSPKVFIPLTMLCRDRCGYCTFAKAPARVAAPYLTSDEVLAIARRGAEFGCWEALFTLGEAPEARYPQAAEWLAANGYGSTVDYLIAAAHRRLGHVQEVIVQNFLPKPGTAMHRAAPCPPDELLWSIAVARLVLPPDVHLQAPPNLSDDLAPLLAAGIDDWGGVSPVTVDHVNPERPWPALERLRAATEAAGHVLAPRLTIYPEFVREP